MVKTHMNCYRSSPINRSHLAISLDFHKTVATLLVSFKMYLQIVVIFAFFGRIQSIYPYFDTQDFIYNVPKVFRISITLDRLLDYYEKKPSKDPEWYISLAVARGNISSKYANIGLLI